MNDYNNSLASLFVHRTLDGDPAGREINTTLLREQVGPPRTGPTRPPLFRRVRRTGATAWNRVGQRLASWRRRSR